MVMLWVVDPTPERTVGFLGRRRRGDDQRRSLNRSAGRTGVPKGVDSPVTAAGRTERPGS
jgi:hypothetical protein